MIFTTAGFTAPYALPGSLLLSREMYCQCQDKPPCCGEPAEQAALRAGPGTGKLAPGSQVLARCVDITLISAILNTHESINPVLKFHKGAIDLILQDEHQITYC